MVTIKKIKWLPGPRAGRRVGGERFKEEGRDG